MNKFLDQSGLAKVWEKVKSLITTKTEEAKTYTDDEITKVKDFSGATVSSKVNYLTVPCVQRGKLTNKTVKVYCNTYIDTKLGEKQNKLTGTEGQIVVIGTDGTVTVKDPVLTDAELTALQSDVTTLKSDIITAKTNITALQSGKQDAVTGTANQVPVFNSSGKLVSNSSKAVYSTSEVDTKLSTLKSEIETAIAQAIDAEITAALNASY